MLSSFGLIGLLAACAGTPAPSTMPVAQEAAQYRARAHSYYAPPGPPDDPWGPYIDEASKRFDVPDAWIRAVMHQESGGHQFAVSGTLTTSPVGAMGLMQLMPPTYDDLRVQYNLGDDAFEPHDNIMAGTAYVRQMYDVYGAPGFLAAYNTGPGRLDDFLTRNRPLPRETRLYVAAIGPHIAGSWPKNRSPTDLLVASHAGASAVQYAASQSDDQTRSIRRAWIRRRDLDQSSNQPVEVAEAPAVAPSSAPDYSRAWTGAAPAAQLAAAVPTRMQPSDAPVASSVSAAWAARTGVAPVAAPAPAPTVQLAASSASDGDDAAAPAPVRRDRFRLIRPAMAEPAPLLRDAGRAPGPRNWSIQVGAFVTQAQASQAAGAAQAHSPMLSYAHTEIAGIRQNRGGKVYRARLIGLSRGDALAACQRLSRGRNDCMVVSPDARS